MSRPSYKHDRVTGLRTQDVGRGRVAIIGAGISGLIAARTLQDQGQDVAIFDKARGPGGRMATARREAYMFDHGAQYFTARDPRFHQHVKIWWEQGLVERWDGRLGVRQSGIISAKSTAIDRFVAVPRMSALTRNLSSGLNGSWGCQVEAARWESGQWTLNVNDGEAGPFEVLIVATPPEQALPLLTDVPDLAKCVATVAMAPCWALMLVFNEQLPVEYDGLFINEGPLSWTARNSSKPGRPKAESWVVHATAAWSKKNLERVKGDALSLLLPEFFRALQIDPLEPVFAEAHRWRYALAENALDDGCLFDPDRRVVVAGDWVNGSKVEGALLSGLAAAGTAAQVSSGT